jgi:putative hemin transport protein
VLNKKILVLIIAGLTSLSSLAAESLSSRWDKLRQEQPKIQTRDAAKALGVSEVELLATQEQAIRLQSGFDASRKIMRRALDLGEVLALSRNENGVIEVTGVATRVTPKPQTEPLDEEAKLRQHNAIGGYIGGPIDLRFHFTNWAHAFALVQTREGKTTRSLQFFDHNGDAIHKIYVKSEAGAAVFDQLVSEFRLENQRSALSVSTKSAKKIELDDKTIDQEEFQLAWKEMTDVHQFSRLVTEFKLNREQALRLAPEGYTKAIGVAAIRRLLDGAAKEKIAIMAFLGNVGITQIFSGQIQKTAAHEDWYNVLDPKFNLHLRESAFARGWVVKRANITSVEFYDKQGELVVTFFGVRGRGEPQPQAWLDLVQGLPSASL